ncbi:hypothetical protein H1R17_01305 [Flavobacterium sp. xlx-214]|uniref:hypothetical protein n=1 Tax=unclassified Flavobacterium TaxID=196869 RepID=UPI0013D1F95C|nr:MULTISPECIES: hypothetical protein [unclassified Flavobacterium]MBA5792657.1 hypothetical protein [Flavobacterium sp. xlx-221]QMI83805.1 hypothetical protein H1R17_01305 [Flavobacterium sp. xlx-214]
MKNKILLTIILLVANFSFAQQKYEVFGIDNKFGIVDYETGNEFIEPQFVNYKNFFIDFVDFETETELILFNKISGKKVVYKKGQNESFYLRKVNSNMKESTQRLHIIENNKSTVVDAVNNKITLPKKYSKLQTNDAWLFGFNENETIDVYSYDDFKKIKVTIKASKFIKDWVYKLETNDYKNHYVFYNELEVFVYDEVFNLVKKYATGGNTYSEIKEVIKTDFKVSSHISQGVFMDEWKVTYSNGYSNFNYIKQLSFQLKGNFEALTKGWDYILIEENNSQKKYFFFLDYENKRFSLPKAEQIKLDLHFLE